MSLAWLEESAALLDIFAIIALCMNISKVSSQNTCTSCTKQAVLAQPHSLIKVGALTIRSSRTMDWDLGFGRCHVSLDPPSAMILQSFSQAADDEPESSGEAI